MTENLMGLEIHDEWLDFRMPYEGKVIPVRISREAMEDHFDAKEGGGKALAEAYLRNQKAVHERIARKVDPKVPYSAADPLVILSADV